MKTRVKQRHTHTPGEDEHCASRLWARDIYSWHVPSPYLFQLNAIWALNQCFTEEMYERVRRGSRSLSVDGSAGPTVTWLEVRPLRLEAHSALVKESRHRLSRSTGKLREIPPKPLQFHALKTFLCYFFFLQLSSPLLSHSYFFQLVLHFNRLLQHVWQRPTSTQPCCDVENEDMKRGWVKIFWGWNT